MPLEFARTPEELGGGARRPARGFVLLDLTGGFDYERVFETVEAARRPPVLGFTTHALARQTPALARALRARRDQGDADPGAAARSCSDGVAA